VLLIAAPLVVVAWVLPVSAEWGEWASGTVRHSSGPVAAGAGSVAGSAAALRAAGDLQAAAGKDFAALAVLLSGPRVPGLLPEPCGKGKAGRDTARAGGYADCAKR
jgi:hypothetical protein